MTKIFCFDDRLINFVWLLKKKWLHCKFVRIFLYSKLLFYTSVNEGHLNQKKNKFLELNPFNDLGSFWLNKKKK